jgi:hypothetical protein
MESDADVKCDRHEERRNQRFPAGEDEAQNLRFENGGGGQRQDRGDESYVE